MAITKVMHMKASGKARIDIHLEHAINYILQPKKLGDANLAGGINCLPDTAYEQMKSTKQMFGKAGGRQGYHFVLSLKPGEGTPEIMYDIAIRFAEKAFGGKYETVVAVHTDRNHLHAHMDCTLLLQNTAKSLKIWHDRNGSENRYFPSGLNRMQDFVLLMQKIWNTLFSCWRSRDLR